MKQRTLLGATLALVFITPAIAGPCTQRIADLERSMEVSTGEGTPKTATADSASAATKSAATTAQAKDTSEGMDMLKEAKELDGQGKEKECMDVVGNVAPTKAPLANQ